MNGQTDKHSALLHTHTHTQRERETDRQTDRERGGYNKWSRVVYSLSSARHTNRRTATSGTEMARHIYKRLCNLEILYRKDAVVAY